MIVIKDFMSRLSASGRTHSRIKTSVASVSVFPPDILAEFSAKSNRTKKNCCRPFRGKLVDSFYTPHWCTQRNPIEYIHSSKK